MPKGPFLPYEFTATQWSSQEDKAAFANDLLQFIDSGFKQTLFTKKLYNRLSMTFGHIAHSCQGGFYEEWFTCDTDRLRFLEHLLRWPCHGQPDFTFCDVERALQQEVRRRNLVDRYRLLVQQAVREKELRLLAQLEQKHRHSETADSTPPVEPAPLMTNSEVDLPPKQFTLF